MWMKISKGNHFLILDPVIGKLSIFRETTKYVCKNYINLLISSKFYKSKCGSSISNENLVSESRCAATIKYTPGFGKCKK